MMSLLSISLISGGMIFLTSIWTYEILRFVWKAMPKMNVPAHFRVLLLMAPIFLAHIVSIWMYAVVYFILENYANFGVLTDFVQEEGESFANFMKCLYFSASTYSSLGFGDVVPLGDLRMLTGAEVLNGLILIGWTASFTYLAMERFWSEPHSGHRWRNK